MSRPPTRLGFAVRHPTSRLRVAVGRALDGVGEVVRVKNRLVVQFLEELTQRVIRPR